MFDITLQYPGGICEPIPVDHGTKLSPQVGESDLGARIYTRLETSVGIWKHWHQELTYTIA